MRGEPAGTEDPPAAEVDEDAEAEQIAEKLCSHTEDKGEMCRRGIKRSEVSRDLNFGDLCGRSAGPGRASVASFVLDLRAAPS